MDIRSYLMTSISADETAEEKRTRGLEQTQRVHSKSVKKHELDIEE
jgi:hypothetical protein